MTSAYDPLEAHQAVHSSQLDSQQTRKYECKIAKIF
jgi:hypothetical protein